MLTANLNLLLITVIWGVTFPLIRDAMENVDPYLFVSTRFILASLLLLPFVIKKIKNTTSNIILHSLILGSLNSITYLSQTIGLQTIPASRSAFITGFNVVLVPLLAPLLNVGKLKLIDFIASLLCLVGIYILTGANFNNFTTGDAWTFLCAISCSLQILYLQLISTKINDYELLAFYQLVFTIPLALFFSFGQNYSNLLHANVLTALAFCSLFATTIAFFIQAKYQRYTTAAKAALIFALEPVFASIFGYFINGEAITPQIVHGGLLILVSLTLPTLLELGLKKVKQ